MSQQEREPTWHEEALEEIESRNGSFAVVSDSDNGKRIRVWAVKSESDPMKIYYVIDLFEYNRRICTCDGFRFQDTCKHLGWVPEL